jgi:hypothetical protein
MGDAFIFQSIIEGAALTAALVGVSKLVVRRTGKPEVSIPKISAELTIHAGVLPG